MRTKPRRRLLRWATFVLMALPVVQTGACVQIAQRSVINGFFNAYNDQLQTAVDQYVADQSANTNP